MKTETDLKIQNAQVMEHAPDLLDMLIEESHIARSVDGKRRARQLVGELVEQAIEGHVREGGELETAINERIAELDRLISAQLNEVLHAAPFQKLEGSWRGLAHLVHNTETSQNLKIRVLNCTREELYRDLHRAPEFDQSSLFKKIYEAEYGTFGGEPYGLLIGDFDFSSSPQDVSLLSKLSQVAAAAHAPLITSAAAQLFNLDSYTELGNPRDLSKIFNGPEYIKWNEFRNTEDSRYVALTLPRFLSRLPYGSRTNPVETFDFEEQVNGSDHTKYLWSNAAYLLGTCITTSFSRYGWCSAIRGAEGGGLVEGLNIHTFSTDHGTLAAKCPTEVAITDRRDKELSDLGFIPLVHAKGSPYAAFFSGQTANKPKQYTDESATASAELSSRLPFIMATSRIAHYLKAIIRDKVGGFQTREGIQRYLEKWIAQYVLVDDNASQAQKARKPLREAKVMVEEIPGSPGTYRAVAHLKPHFQLEAMAVSLRLVTQLPPATR